MSKDYEETTTLKKEETTTLKKEETSEPTSENGSYCGYYNSMFLKHFVVVILIELFNRL